jgi:hypothetical protein
MILAEGVQMDPKKFLLVLNFPKTTSIKKLQSFLGLMNFSLHFVPHLASVTQPLRALLAKEAEFRWNEDCQHSFIQLNHMIQKVAILAHPDFSKLFKL